MRQLAFFILLAAAVSLGGCASSRPTAVCARVSEFDLRQQLSQPSHWKKPVQKLALAHHSHSEQPTALPLPVKEEVPEPKPTSAAWWMRENARLGKAIIICRGCLPEATANLSRPKPAVLSPESDPQLHPGAAMNDVDGLVAADTLDHR